MATRKILTITLEIEVNETRTHHDRIKKTYGEVVEAAMEAARANMPEGSIEQITTHARWEYRHWDPEPITYPKGEIPEDEDPFDEDDIEWEDES